MNNNTVIFDNWLQELEASASEPALQIDQHWEMLRKELQMQTPPAAKPFFSNPLFMGPIILLATLGGFYLVTQKNEPASSIHPATRPVQQPAINSATGADTSPVNKPTKKSPPAEIKNPIAIQSKSDSIPDSVQAKTTKALPVKSVFGVSSTNRQSSHRDTLVFIHNANDGHLNGDSFHLYTDTDKTQPQNFHIKTTRKRTSIATPVFLHTAVSDKKDTVWINNPKKVTATPVHADNDSTTILISDTTRYQQLEAILQEPWFKGKVVYIDLWGTRCGPCLEEFKHLPALKEKYKEKDIAFLYLKSPYSFDDSKEWKDMVGRYHLRGVNISMSIQFYVDGFWKKYAEKYPEERWYTIPTYLIANKNGTIVNFDAPRPSNKGQLYPLLDKLLSN